FVQAEGGIRVWSVTGVQTCALPIFWTLYAMGALDAEFLRKQLGHPNEHVRAWAIRFLTDNWPLDTVMSRRPAGRADANVPPATRSEERRVGKERRARGRGGGADEGK